MNITYQNQNYKHIKKNKTITKKKKKSKLKSICLVLFTIVILSGLFISSYYCTTGALIVNNTPRDAINSFCTSLNQMEAAESIKYTNANTNSETSRGLSTTFTHEINEKLLSNCSSIEITPSNICEILKGDNNSSYTVTFTINKTLRSGEKVSNVKTIPVRLLKENTTWVIDYSSIEYLL